MGSALTTHLGNSSFKKWSLHTGLLLEAAGHHSSNYFFSQKLTPLLPRQILVSAVSAMHLIWAFALSCCGFTQMSLNDKTVHRALKSSHFYFILNSIYMTEVKWQEMSSTEACLWTHCWQKLWPTNTTNEIYFYSKKFSLSPQMRLNGTKKEENKIQNQIINRPQYYEIFPYIIYLMVKPELQNKK